jgi:endonuclease YncB( thermonuclease family)
LAILEKNNININKKLVDEGYAKKYNGGTKDKW